MVEEDMDVIADFLDRVIKICLKVQETTGKALKDFEEKIKDHEELVQIGKEVEVSFKFL